MRPKVTVIMPSLNVASYIKACVESVLHQTLSDIEILVIDAGSTDGTLELLREYEKQDSRLQVIISEKKSYGYQINKGITYARGECIGIVETDDIIVPDMYKILYDIVESSDVDYVKGRGMLFKELKAGIEWSHPLAFPLEKKEMIGKVIEPRVMPELLLNDIYLWTGIYKKEFVRKILLNETPGAAFQDQGFLFQTISTAQKAVYVDEIVYKYRQDNSGSSILSRKGFQYLVEEYAYIEKFLTGKNRKWKSIYYQRMLSQSFVRFKTMAIFGTIWKEAVSDMEILRKRLGEAVENKVLILADMDIQRQKILELFLFGIEHIFAYCVAEYREKLDGLNYVLKTVGQRQIIIFGCGVIGKFFHALIDSMYPNRVVAYCDNNFELWHTTIQGIVVISAEEAMKQYPDAVYVIANLRNTETIKEQLLAFGIENESICIYQEMPDTLLLHVNDEQLMQ